MMLTAFCAVGHFVAENAQWRLGMAVYISEGHITCDGGTRPSYARFESSLKLSDSAEPQLPVCGSSEEHTIPLEPSFFTSKFIARMSNLPRLRPANALLISRRGIC